MIPRRPAGGAGPIASATSCPKRPASSGLEDELRLARAITTWDALIAERVPPAAGSCRLVRLEHDTIVVAADEPIVAAELRLRASEILAAFGAAPGGVKARYLRLTGERDGSPGSGGGRRV